MQVVSYLDENQDAALGAPSKPGKEMGVAGIPYT